MITLRMINEIVFVINSLVASFLASRKNKKTKKDINFFPIIPKHKTDQIKLTASYLKKKQGAHRLPTLNKKVTIIKGFLRPGPNVPYVTMNINYSVLCLSLGLL